MDLAEWLFLGGSAETWSGSRPGGKPGGKPLQPAPPAPVYAPSGGGSIGHYFANPMPNTTGAGAQRTVDVTQGSIAAINSILPVMYGAGLRQGALVAGIVEYQGVLYLLALCSHGKVRAFGDVLIDDVEASGAVTVESYHGTATQEASALLTAAYESKGVTFADKMPGVAYRVIGIPGDYGLQSFPRITIEVADAIEVLDVRTGAAVGASNPVNALADMITSTVYGAGRTYNAASFRAAADFCDEQVGSTVQIPRKRLALSLSQSMKIDDVITLLASYTGCFCWNTGGQYFLAPLRRSASVAFFNDANMVADSFRMSRRAMRDQPTSATVTFTDTTVTPYHARPARVEMPEVTAGTFPDRNMSSSMPGVTSYAQARHDAVEYLNRAIVARIEAQWGAFDEAVSLTPGAVVTLHKPKYGLSNALMLVRDVVDQGFGRYVVNAETYADATFSDVVLAGPPAIDSGGMVPGTIITFAGPVTGVEELEQIQSGEWLDRIRFTWPNPANVAALAYYAAVLYDVTDGHPGVQMSARNTPTNVYVTDMLTEGRIYRLGVATVSYVGAASPVVWSADIPCRGKLLAPSDVPALQITVMDQSVFLVWKAATDLDLDGYEIRRGAVGQAWAAMTFLDHLYALTDFLPGQPAGTWDYAIKARDTSGNSSATERRVSAVIQAADFGMLAAHTWTAAEAALVSNFGKYQASDGSWRFVNINSAGLWGDGADNPDNAVGTFNDNLKDTIIAAPTAAGSATLTWSAYDFGALFTGTWNFAGTCDTIYGPGPPDLGYYLSAPATAFVVVAHASATSPDSVNAVTGAIDTTGADLLLAHVGSYFDNTAPGVVDSKGNTWAPLANHGQSAGTSSRFWYVKNPIVGTGHTFNVSTAAGACYPAIAVAAFKGADLLAPFDQQSGGSAAAGAPPQLVGAITPTQAGELVVAGISEYGGFVGAMAIDQGFAILDSRPFSSGKAFGTTLAWKFQAAITTLNPSWSWTSGGDYRAYGCASFKLGAAWVRFPNNSVTGARIARVDVVVPSGTVVRLRDDWRVTCTANVREESGSVDVPASGVATVSLRGKYSQRVSLILTAGSTTTGRAYATWSNVVLSASATNTFQINVVDLDTGAAKAATVDYYWKGI